MKKNSLIILALFTLCGCQRSCTKFETSVQKDKIRDYNVVVFSAGDTVFVDSFRGIVNVSKDEKTIYYTKNDELIEISGEYILRSKAIPEK
jgi:hypothetical protein